MTDGFRFAGIDDHIARVDEHAARMERVVEAARPLDHGAYGVIGQLFTVSVSAAADEAVASVRQIEAVGAAHAEGLRWTRDAYLEADRRAEDDVAAMPGGTP